MSLSPIRTDQSTNDRAGHGRNKTRVVASAKPSAPRTRAAANSPAIAASESASRKSRPRSPSSESPQRKSGARASHATHLPNEHSSTAAPVLIFPSYPPMDGFAVANFL